MNRLKRVTIEPTSRCNLNCTMCFRNTWVESDFSDMSSLMFTGMMETMPASVESVLFGGMGEPLLHQDIDAMVETAARQGKQVELITNASLLTPETSSRLIDAGLGILWVSIDSFEERAYAAIRQNADLATVMANLDTFNRLRQQKRSPVSLALNFTAMRSNVHQLQQLPRVMRRFRVDRVNVSNIIPSNRESEAEILFDGIAGSDLPPQDRNQPRIDLPPLNARHAGVLEGLTTLLSVDNIEVALSGHVIRRKTRHCRFVDEGISFVRHDGNVSPCMALLHGATTFWLGNKRTVHHHSFGNVADRGIADIWESPAYERFRNRVRTFDFSPCMRCSGCDSWDENKMDCFGNEMPTCGACLWAEGVISCP